MTSPLNVESAAAATRDVVIASLRHLLGDRLSTTVLVREQHGRDASYHPCVQPDVVAFAQSTEEVSEMVKFFLAALALPRRVAAEPENCTTRQQRAQSR